MQKDNNNNNKNEIKKEKQHTRKPLKPVALLSGIEELRQDFEERIAQGDVVYGLEILDDAVETIRKGSITFIVAAQNTGKSLVGQIIACNLAKQGKKVLICSCEMGAGLLMERQIKSLTGISANKLKETYETRRDTANYIMDSLIEDEKYSYLKNIDICETGGAYVEDITDMLDSFPEYNYVVVDYIQRIKGTGSEYENVTYASREIQTYARDSGKSFIVCSQAGRQSQNDAAYGKEKDGTRIKGKGSGSIEEDADVVITLMGEDTVEGKNILATITKNRYGSIKNVTYRYKLDEKLKLILVNRSV